MTNVLESLLKKVAAGESLSREEAESAMHAMMRGEADADLIAGFLLGLRERQETLDELVGFTKVMREYALPVTCRDGAAIDMCGTGGDGSGTFNISTAAAFVCAGAGATVAKHGNRSVSSKCGSADVLESLGVKTELERTGVERCLDDAGIGFIFAPMFHPALKHVMPVRRKLGVRTFFNILGPLCNPARVKRQLTGAFTVDVARTMAAILVELGANHVICVHSEDGLDEFSTGADSTYFEFERSVSDETRTEVFSPSALGMPVTTVEDLAGGDAATNAAIIKSILEGARGPKRRIVVLNAAFALTTTDRFTTLKDAVIAAEQSIDEGRAQQSLAKLIRVSNAA